MVAETRNLAVHVSLAPAARRAPAAPVPCAPLLEAAGARVLLGAPDEGDVLATPVVPSAHTLFGPRGVCALADGSLWVADTGHHRVLGWPALPTADNQAAVLLLGQPVFAREGRNAGGEPSATSLNVPTGLCGCGADSLGLAVADAWNHRVLLWWRRPQQPQQAPDLVLGQADLQSGLANRGADRPDAASLFWPYGVAWDGRCLWVADSGNRRVLMWQGLPQRHGAPADLVLGQPGFDGRDDNGGHAAGARSMRWPHAISFPAGGLCVADAGNNRLMRWRTPPQAHNAACDVLLGQPTAQHNAHNQNSHHPDAACLNMPYGTAVAGGLLLVADTANSRLLAWPEAMPQAHGGNAVALAAQPDWHSKGDNRWGPARRDSLCWPYGLAVAPATGAGPARLLVADSGNNRVLLWSMAA